MGWGGRWQGGGSRVGVCFCGKKNEGYSRLMDSGVWTWKEEPKVILSKINFTSYLLLRLALQIPCLKLAFNDYLPKYNSVLASFVP